jgi:hypothetical protein
VTGIIQTSVAEILDNPDEVLGSRWLWNGWPRETEAAANAA